MTGMKVTKEEIDALKYKIVSINISRENDDWKENGYCNKLVEDGIDSDIWFPEKENNTLAKVAIGYCVQCPVRANCLEYSIRNKIPEGIWGGMTTRMRNRIARDIKHEFKDSKPINHNIPIPKPPKEGYLPKGTLVT
jgi:hypothetical protein